MIVEWAPYPPPVNICILIQTKFKGTGIGFWRGHLALTSRDIPAGAWFILLLSSRLGWVAAPVMNNPASTPAVLSPVTSQVQGVPEPAALYPWRRFLGPPDPTLEVQGRPAICLMSPLVWPVCKPKSHPDQYPLLPYLGGWRNKDGCFRSPRGCLCVHRFPQKQLRRRRIPRWLCVWPIKTKQS